MADEWTCPKCESRMDHGFILDCGDYNVARQAAWIAGDAKKSSFWTGWRGAATRAQLKNALPIITLRCTTCGYLESYAPPPAPKA